MSYVPRRGDEVLVSQKWSGRVEPTGWPDATFYLRLPDGSRVCLNGNDPSLTVELLARPTPARFRDTPDATADWPAPRPDPVDVADNARLGAYGAEVAS